MTTTRARSSSGEKGTVSTSSTPWSKASSLRLRSPRRVSARIGTAPPAPRRRAERTEGCRPAEVHVDDRHVRLPLADDRPRLVQRGDIARHECAVVQREADQVDDQGLVGQDKHAMRRRCLRHHDETVMIPSPTVNTMALRSQVPGSRRWANSHTRSAADLTRTGSRCASFERGGWTMEASESLRRWVKGAQRVEHPRR